MLTTRVNYATPFLLARGYVQPIRKAGQNGEENRDAEARAALTEARRVLGWSRAAAAAEAGVHRNTIGAWETVDESWGARLAYLRSLLNGDSATARTILLRHLNLEEEELLKELDADFVNVLRSAYQHRDDPAVAQTLELLRTLCRGEDRAATA